MNAQISDEFPQANLHRAGTKPDANNPNSAPHPTELDLDPLSMTRLANLIAQLAAAYRGPTLVDRIRALLVAVAARTTTTETSTSPDGQGARQ
jgi:hypothetical protein